MTTDLSGETSDLPAGVPRTGPARERTDEVPVGVAVSLVACVLAFLGVAIWRSTVVDVPLRDPLGGEWLRHRVLFSLAVVLATALADGWRRSRAAGTSYRTALRLRWTPRRVGWVALALACYHLTYFSYHNLKSWNAFRTVRDPLLDSWDRWLFLGHEPAVLLHDWLGTGAAHWILLTIYESFPTLVTVSFPAALVLVDRVRQAWVFIASLVFVWMLGTLSYYLYPSLGPFHYRPQDFADLPHSMVTDTQARYLQQRESFLADPQAPHRFAQIGAFASLHVGVSSVIWLTARYYRMRRTARVLGIFVFGTSVATVYLGWHFFVDDLAGLAIAALACAAGRRLVYPRGEAETADRAAPLLGVDG